MMMGGRIHGIFTKREREKDDRNVLCNYGHRLDVLFSPEKVVYNM